MSKKSKRKQSKASAKTAPTSWINKHPIAIFSIGAIALCYVIAITTMCYMDTLPHLDTSTRAALFSSVTGFAAMVGAALAVVLTSVQCIRKGRRA